MARLILATAEGQQAIELRPINSLGRHPNNSIQLLDKIVSKEHCIVEQRDGQFILRDLGSLNGTYINGERVRGEQLLRHGDEIALGSTRARYDDGTQPLPPTAPLPMAVAAGLPPPAIVQPGPAAVQGQQGGMPAWPQPSNMGAPASVMQQQPSYPGMQPQRPAMSPAMGFQGVPQQPRVSAEQRAAAATDDADERPRSRHAADELPRGPGAPVTANTVVRRARRASAARASTCSTPRARSARRSPRRRRASCPSSRSRTTRSSSASTTSACASRGSSRATSASSATSTSCSTRSCSRSSSS